MQRKKLLLISGKKRTGKDTFANVIVSKAKKDNLKSSIYHMSNELKERAFNDTNILIDRVNKFIDELKEKYNESDIINDLYDNLYTTKEHFGTGDKTIISRSILEFYGTDIFINRIDKNYWSKEARKDILKLADSNDIIIVPDIRFESDIDTITANLNDIFDIYVIRTNRPDIIDNNMHISNIALDNYNKFDFIINARTLFTLYKKSITVYNRIFK